MSVSVHRQLYHKTLLCTLETVPWETTGERDSGSLPVGGVETSLSYYFSVGRHRGIVDTFSTHLPGKIKNFVVAWAGFVWKPLGTQVT